MRTPFLGITLVCACFNPGAPRGDDAGSLPSETDGAVSGGSGSPAETGGGRSEDGSAEGDTSGGESSGDAGEPGDPEMSSEDTGLEDELCGNGDLDEGEECDLGISNSDSGACTDSCTLAVCGDGLVFAGEEACDDAGESEACNADCSTATCGDGILNVTAGEACDSDAIAQGACVECQVQCDDGWLDCGGGLADGCEVDSVVDAHNCGACDNTCGADEICGAGDCLTIRRVFISSQVVWADFGGVQGADDLCQQMADDAGLGGTFMAWVSSADEQASVADRFTPHDGPYVLMDGTVIADDWTDLTDGTLDAPILVDEYGNAPGGFAGGNCHGGATCTTVFTGSNGAGGAYVGQHDDCDGWSTTTYLPAFAGGTADRTDEGWSLFAIGLRCDYAARIYCFEQ